MRAEHFFEMQRLRVQAGQISPPTGADKAEKTHSGESFDRVLKKEIEKTQNITFSKHARIRMSERNITLTDSHLNRLDEAVKKAGQKGVKDTLVLMDEMAFIVSVRNSTVVTALTGGDIKGNVFTQIDGAVIV